MKLILLVLFSCLFFFAINGIQVRPIVEEPLKIVDKERLWSQYKIKYNKQYEDKKFNCKGGRKSSLAISLDQEHKKIFFDSVDVILKNNLDFKAKKATYEMSLNKFSDINTTNTLGFFHDSKHCQQENVSDKQQYYSSSSVEPESFARYHKLSSLIDLPLEFDWRNYKFQSKVRDQGECGACWAITIAGALEGIYSWIYNDKEQMHFSEQELVDCSDKDHGCDGGWFDTALEYISSKPSKWLSSYDDYPYVGQKSDCLNSMKESQHGLEIIGHKRIKANDEEALREALILSGPIPVAIHVTANLYKYSQGVFQDSQCTAEGLNHAVLLVGYGYDEGTSSHYWILKNSWGEDWGEKGYFRLLKGLNMCGVSSYAISPIFKY